MIDREHGLCVTKQAELVGITRSTVYYLPRPVSAADVALMKQIHALHTEFPFAGSRMLRRLLAANGSKVGRRHVKTLMQRMGIEALYRRPRTTRPEPEHKVFPYLLRGIEIERPNQVWAMDITYIPMAKGFVYLAVVLDWFSRRVLAWRLSITLEAAFCIEALQEALARHGKPEIVNTDQGSQFTGAAFTGVLAAKEIRISMDGKGAWRDNVFVERLWRTIKYEEVYLTAYESDSAACAGIGLYPIADLGFHLIDESLIPKGLLWLRIGEGDFVMEPRQPARPTSFGPDDLRVIFRAYDDAWSEIAPKVGTDPAAVET